MTKGPTLIFIQPITWQACLAPLFDTLRLLISAKIYIWLYDPNQLLASLSLFCYPLAIILPLPKALISTIVFLFDIFFFYFFFSPSYKEYRIRTLDKTFGTHGD